MIAIEEFAKGVWLYFRVLQTKNDSGIKNISDKNTRPYFKSHRTKIRYFFNFVKRIPNYKVKSGYVSSTLNVFCQSQKIYSILLSSMSQNM